jgi:hypothetical protein
VARRFGYGSRPHRSDRPRVGMVFLLDGPRFPRRGSRSTCSNGEVQKTMKTSSGRMVKCWIPKFYLTNPNTELSTSCRPV